MISDGIEHELREALAHLYDPDYVPSEAACTLVGCDVAGGALAVQSAVIHAIGSLEPPPSAPPSAQTRQAYELLHNRFVMKLTQEETAYRLHWSLSSTRRAQRAAVHTLARVLWERSQRLAQAPRDQDEEGRGQRLSEGEPATQALDWQAQMRHELDSLRARAPDTVSDVEGTISGVLKLTGALTSGRSVSVRVGAIQPGLIAAIHPSALRQILIAAIGRLVRHTPAGEIMLFARLEDGNVKITLASTIAPQDTLAAADLIRDIPTPEDTSIEAHIEDSRVFLWVTLASVGKITVLVVDDNLDMVRFYRRSTEGTSYHIVQVTEGRRLFEAIEATPPDIIVLDVMLPDVDGWELMMRLHEDRATRSIPVIICSVVREEELALSLGASLYLSKPVRRRQFIEALDRALRPRPTASPIVPMNNEAAC